MIITHRDPIKCVASMAHMSCSYRPEILTDRYDRAALARYYGELWLENLGTMVDNMMDARARLPEHAIYDLHYSHFIRDPVRAMRHIYEHFGEPFDPPFQRALHDFLRANPGDRFGTRSFTMEEFGLTELAIRIVSSATRPISG